LCGASAGLVQRYGCGCRAGHCGCVGGSAHFLVFNRDVSDLSACLMELWEDFDDLDDLDDEIEDEYVHVRILVIQLPLSTPSNEVHHEHVQTSIFAATFTGATVNGPFEIVLILWNDYYGSALIPLLLPQKISGTDS
jgi:hypothetical protein